MARVIRRSLHSRMRRIDGHLSQLIYKDGSNVFVELWLRKKSGSSVLASTEIFRGAPTIMLPCSVGLIVEAETK